MERLGADALWVSAALGSLVLVALALLSQQATGNARPPEQH
jgi:hypothetical protein